MPSESKAPKKDVGEKLKNFFKTYFKKINLPFYIGMIVMALGLFLLDYFSKHWAYDNLEYGDKAVTFIPGLIDFQLVFNNGAAWGSLSGQSWFLVTISLIASLALLFFLLFRFDKYNATIRVGISLMLPGAVGNLVDRIGYMAQAGIYKKGVIDFLVFDFWKSFPVCNVADYCLSVGVVVLIVGLIIELVRENQRSKKDMEKAKSEASAKEANVSQAETLKEEKAEEEDMAKKLQSLEEKTSNEEAPSETEEKKEDSSENK